MPLQKEEITRKLLHFFALLMPAGIYYIPRMDYPVAIPIGILALLLGGSILIEWLRFRSKTVQKLFFTYFGSMLRSEEKTKTTGSTYVIAASLLCAILFRNHLHIAFIVLSLFILGDGIAAIAGLSLGRIKIGKKSLEGSIACFALCLLLIYGVFPFLPGILDSWGNRVPLIFALIISFSITILELFPIKINSRLTFNDNLAVPVITGYVVLALEKILL
ncbi:Cytidylyltransferase [Chitinispirillum alkaliphilum]|nr:Cytidylyltransferase [Chitinispirillum alkaliphilum]